GGVSGLLVTQAGPQSAKEKTPMRDNKDPRAVAVARAHIEAWSHHDWEKARQCLTARREGRPRCPCEGTTTQPVMAPTDTVGADMYMEALMKFATNVAPGRARILAAVGDTHNALVTVTVKAAIGPGGEQVTLLGARLYLLDDNGKIKAEQ